MPNASPAICGSRSVAETVTVCVPPPAGIVAGDIVRVTSNPVEKSLMTACEWPELPSRSWRGNMPH